MAYAPILSKTEYDQQISDEFYMNMEDFVQTQKRQTLTRSPWCY